MKRADLAAEYTVNASGNITDPGKFEGEALYVPYFWEFFLNGGADEDDGDTLWFDVSDDDRREFPELSGIARVALSEDSQGFVSCECFHYHQVGPLDAGY